MGYWYCKAKIYERKEVEVERKTLFGKKKKTESRVEERIVEGKVFSMTNEGGTGSYNGIMIITKEGKNPVMELVSHELGISEEEGDYMGDFITDEILELNYIKD